VIDWLTISAPLRHSDRITGGATLVIDEHGVVKFKRPHGKIVEGSHESRVMVWTERESMNYVYVSGNPAKFLQGHNVFGSNDLGGLVGAFL